MALIPLSQDHEAVRKVKTDRERDREQKFGFFFLI